MLTLLGSTNIDSAGQSCKGGGVFLQILSRWEHFGRGRGRKDMAEPSAPGVEIFGRRRSGPGPGGRTAARLL